MRKLLIKIKRRNRPRSACPEAMRMRRLFRLTTWRQRWPDTGILVVGTFLNVLSRGKSPWCCACDECHQSRLLSRCREVIELLILQCGIPSCFPYAITWSAAHYVAWPLKPHQKSIVYHDSMNYKYFGLCWIAKRRHIGHSHVNIALHISALWMTKGWLIWTSILFEMSPKLDCDTSIKYAPCDMTQTELIS